MATRENDRNSGNLPGQHPTGPWDQAHEHLNPKEPDYGQDKDVTNLNRDHQHVNAANQAVKETPDFSRQVRDGQYSEPENRSGSGPGKGRDASRRNQDEPNRREEKRQVSGAGDKITNSQGNDQFKIDDSSKFSE